MKYLSFLSAISLVLLFGWGCNTSKNASNPKVEDIPGRVHVLLQGPEGPKKLMKHFTSYELKNEGQISRTETRYSFSFNTSKITAEKLIEEINALPYASEATIPQQVKD